MDISLPITGWAAVANATLLLALTWTVVRYRRRLKIVLGDGGEKAVEKAIRGQANAAEQMPMALILMGLCELSGANTSSLIGLAVIFTLGRLLHGAYFAGLIPWRGRFYGMLLTLIGQAGLILLLAVTLIL